jgi:hypothetical protein
MWARLIATRETWIPSWSLKSAQQSPEATSQMRTVPSLEALTTREKLLLSRYSYVTPAMWPFMTTPRYSSPCSLASVRS